MEQHDNKKFALDAEERGILLVTLILAIFVSIGVLNIVAEGVIHLW